MKEELRDNGRLPVFRLILAAIVFFQSANAVPAQNFSPIIEIAAVGDILLTRGVERKIEKFGADYPFENVQNMLINADLAFGNLENPLAENCRQANKKFSFQSKPVYSKILASVGFDVLSLANNHTSDCGQKGLLETIENLRRENLRSIGAAKTGTDAETPVYVEIKGIKIAFLGFSAISSQSYFSKIAPATNEKVKQAVTLARQNVDAVIVSFHWGTEYDSRPNFRQIELANAAIQAGADAVLGHHPHVLQGFRLVEKRNNARHTLVAFSLGNFLFDSPARLIKKTSESVILKIRFNKNGLVSAKVIPVNIENTRPVIADKEKKEIIFNRLNKLSGEWNTFLDAGEIKPMKSVYANKSD